MNGNDPGKIVQWMELKDKGNDAGKIVPVAGENEGEWERSR